MEQGAVIFCSHQLVPGHSSLLCLAYFLQGHWTSEQERVVFAGWLGKMDEVVLQCHVPATQGTSWIEKGKQQEQMLLLGPAEGPWS